MKKYLQIFKIPFIVLALFLLVGITCKVLVMMRTDDYVRNNPECTIEERVFDYGEKLTEKEEEILREKIKKAEVFCGCDIIIISEK